MIGTPEDNSVLLKHEEIQSVFEYAPGKIIVALFTTNFLFLDNWKPVRIKDDWYLCDTQVGNDHKFWIDFIHGFEEDEFPFLICSGRETFNMINVKDYRMEVLIQAPCRNQIAQQAFFSKEEAYGFSLHFCT